MREGIFRLTFNRPTSAVYTRCLVCATPFEANDTLEHLPRGKRLAFDPVRGRLWAICGACKRWSLTPIEERWEALEELERLSRDKALLLSQTDNVALLRSGPLEIVRVGRADLTEEAWWRYGRELASRRQHYQRLSLAGSVTAGAAMLGGWATGGIMLVGMWAVWSNGPEIVADAARWLRFGGAAWRGRRECPRCGHVFHSLPYGDRAGIGLFPGDEPGRLDLVYRCPQCGHYRDGGLRLAGKDAERTLRRALAYHHFSGASEREVQSAARLIRETGTPQDLMRAVVRDGRRLGDLQRTGAVALEIAANETSEQQMLAMELAELEAQWRQEEELAGIIDGELTPLPLLESMRRKVAGQ